MKALTGLRVLDFTHFIAGPYCSQILADHGAEVIKVERLEGEPGRLSMPLHKKSSLYFASQNRHKRGLALNLKAAQSREIIRRLVEGTDILVTNYAVGVPERLGIGYEEISAINPRIIMVHITGFGLTGPYRDYVAFDGVIQAMSGLAEMTGSADGPPTPVGFYIADHIAGLQAAMGAMFAVYSRERTGKGQYVDISMLDGMVSLLGYYPGEVLLSGKNPVRTGIRDRYAFCKIFPAKDGYIFIAPSTQAMWDEFARAIGRKEWAESTSAYHTRESRLECREELEDMISEWTRERSKEEIFHLLQKAGIPCGPAHSILDLVNDPHVKERDMVQMVMTPEGSTVPAPGVPIKLSETPATAGTGATVPKIGEHTEEILRECGFSLDEIEELRKIRVI